ncbi:MAG: hypothetical protein ACJ790_12655 [Myxococcaceae bacterium]
MPLRSRHVAAFALLAALFFAAVHRSQAIAASTAPAHVPHVLLSLTEPTGDTTQIVDREHVWATISHLSGATVMGTLLPDGKSAALIAETTPTRDRSWDSSLVVVGDDGSVRTLADRVYASTRPFLTPTGELLVTRGIAGIEPEPVKGISQPLRMDEITVDAVSPVTGEARTVWRTRGYLSFIAGVAGNEVIVYDLGPGATPLRAIDLTTGNARTVIPDLRLARDFRVAAGGKWMTFTQHVPETLDDWRVMKMELSTGSRTEVVREPTIALFASPLGSAISFNRFGARGLSLDDGREIPCPFGEGADEVLAWSADGSWAAGLHTVPSSFSSPFLLDLRSNELRAVPLPPNVRADVLGVLP